MSGGHPELGTSAAWYEREHRFSGIPFPPLGERFDRLAEQLDIITGLWGPRRGAVQLSRQVLPARGVRQHSRPARRPRIMLGGAGPQRTPASAARFADEFNSSVADGVAGRFASLRRICEQSGRDLAVHHAASVLRGNPRRGRTGDRGEVAGRLAELAEADVDAVCLHLYDVTGTDHIRLLGREVLPR